MTNTLSQPSATGALYLVATPIGNLSDISARAASTLRDVDFIAAEDTRVTQKLLGHLQIKKPLISYYEHNKRLCGEKVVRRLLSGESCALVTDAGTPGISDPGEDLVRLCVEENIPISVIPGPCAAVSALSLSGFSSARFTFEGFLPAEKKKRLLLLNELQAETRTMIFYEAPHKLMRTLTDMLNVFGDRRISVSREMTKIYEETLRLTLSEAIKLFEDKKPRGEFVLVLEGAALESDAKNCLDDAVCAATAYLEYGLSVRDAVKKAADETGCSRNLLYKKMLQISG